MLSILGKGAGYCDGLTRRSFLQIGGLALGGLSLPEILHAEDRAGADMSRKGIIMVLLPGGPSHLDMFDPKPEAPAEIRGEFKPIETAVPGIEICELLPRLAGMMDKLTPIRSLVGARDDHNLHQCITGWETHPEQVGSKEIPGYPPGGWPSFGAVLSKVHGPQIAGIPPAVDLSPVYYDSRFVLSTPPVQGGYLGSTHAGFEVAAVDRKNIVLNGVNVDRLADRKSLLAGFDRFRRQSESDSNLRGADAFREQAFDVLTSPRLAEALDVSREDPATRLGYGLDEVYSQEREGRTLLDQFLLARRVIEAGARCVTMVFSRWPFGRMLKGDCNWDWHTGNFAEARGALPLLDIGLSGLIRDLEQRGMLDDVSVVVWGEFGRTPKINKNAGRDHWPKVAGALLAGGGMQTGQVIGSTNRYGEHVQDRPVHFRDVFATLYQNMGVDVADTQFVDLGGRPRYLVDDHRPIPELIG